MQGKPADNRVVHYAKREITIYIQQSTDEVCEAKWKCVHTEQFPYLHLWIYEVGNQIFTDKVRAVLASLALLQKYPGKSIAHCKYLDFTFLPFYLFTFWGRPEDLEEGNSHFGYWEEVLHIANPLTLPFYLLPFYLFTPSQLTLEGKLIADGHLQFFSSSP